MDSFEDVIFNIAIHLVVSVLDDITQAFNASIPPIFVVILVTTSRLSHKEIDFLSGYTCSSSAEQCCSNLNEFRQQARVVVFEIAVPFIFIDSFEGFAHRILFFLVNDTSQVTHEVKLGLDTVNVLVLHVVFKSVAHDGDQHVQHRDVRDQCCKHEVDVAESCLWSIHERSEVELAK